MRFLFKIIVGLKIKDKKWGLHWAYNDRFASVTIARLCCSNKLHSESHYLKTTKVCFLLILYVHWGFVHVAITQTVGQSSHELDLCSLSGTKEKLRSFWRILYWQIRSYLCDQKVGSWRYLCNCTMNTAVWTTLLVFLLVKCLHE